jgi:hypothetical protein
MKKKDIEKQNRHLLWMNMEFPIVRYLLSNTHGRLNGTEKAERHIDLCAIFLASKLFCSIDKARSNDNWIRIHDATRKLTDNLDGEIGFPIFETPEDYEQLALKFFDRFLELAEEEWKRICT